MLQILLIARELEWVELGPTITPDGDSSGLFYDACLGCAVANKRRTYIASLAAVQAVQRAATAADARDADTIDLDGSAAIPAGQPATQGLPVVGPVPGGEGVDHAGRRPSGQLSTAEV
jgi:hypothetical protein